MAALAVCPRQDIVRSVCRADLLMELAAAQIMGWALEDGFGLRVASGGVLTQDLEQPVGPSLPPASPSSEAMRYQASALPGFRPDAADAVALEKDWIVRGSYGYRARSTAVEAASL